jgi:hypothetical protein
LRWRIGARGKRRGDRRRSAQAVVSPPKDPVAIPRQAHAARLRIQQFEPFLTEFAALYPPTAAISLGAQEVFEDAGLAGHQAIAMVGDGNRDAEWGVDVYGLADNRRPQRLIAKRHGFGACRAARNDAHASGDPTQY